MMRRYALPAGSVLVGAALAVAGGEGYLPAPFVLVGIGVGVGGYFIGLLLEAGGFNDE